MRKSKMINISFSIFLVLFFLFSPLSAEIIPPAELDNTVLTEKIRKDVKMLVVYRDGLVTIMNFLKTEPVFSSVKKEGSKQRSMPTREEKEVLWNTWKSFLDYYIALDSLKQYYSKFNDIKDDKLKKDSFSIFHSAFIVQYRFALDFISEIEKNPHFDTVLNEPVVELGLPEKTYDNFKFEFLNMIKASEFAALNIVRKFYGKSDIDEIIEQDKKKIWDAGKGKGEVLTIKNAFDVIGKIGSSVFIPVQEGVSTWMGDTRVRRKGESLISQEQIAGMLPELQPGDILLERREWYISNIGLPGFWTHAALFIGSPKDRKKYFETEEIKNWVKEQGQKDGDFEELLKSKYPKAYELSLKQQEEGHIPRVLEAIGEGVSFTTLEHSGAADSLGVLRPKLAKIEKANALLRAFQYSGRPYDFNFDFLTDAELVCSELIYKVYEPSKDYNGLKLPLDKVIGRLLLSPNEICRIFDNELNSGNQQMAFVLFLDGNEKQDKAIETGADEFRKSWKRPKWHIIVQKSADEKQEK
ncbi:MAG: YiiX/YebB-like N1pC/P60 family cysteine hydrolase [bacterium]